MNTFNLEAYGVVEASKEEMMEINGGKGINPFWVLILGPKPKEPPPPPPPPDPSWPHPGAGLPPA